MKKNTKVIIMKAKAPNGNNLTYRTLAPLDFTVADAFAYMQKDMFAEYLDPNSTVVKGSWSMIAA